jgi:hypothetical protein
MKLRAVLLSACGAGVALLAAASIRGEAPPIAPGQALPPLEADPSLPPLPERSDRVASYSIDARLDPERHTIEGSLVLEWRNTAGTPLSSFPFHLYWNAFKNNLSTTARGVAGGGRRARKQPALERDFGYTRVRSVTLLDEPAADLTPTLKYLQPDDGNKDDQTVVQVETPQPVLPGATARFRIDWESRIPYGDVGRAGWVHDYHFIVQWFPKIGVYWKGAWNCHQFHPTSEFFADYGTYDVRLTLPEGFVVGATGALQETKTNADGSLTHRYRQDDVHDFAWCASRRFRVVEGRFSDAGYPPVAIRLLLQPEHAHLAERYLEATRIALRGYGAWSVPYPYPQITVVDPSWNSGSGGMEYPTLLTGGANVLAPAALQSPESVTIHETGHQFWYGLVGNNEFEEAWLDEGFNSYHDEKAAQLALGPVGWGHRYFGRLKGGRGGVPYVAPGVWKARGEADLPRLREVGQADRMARRSWEYLTRDSYSLNSYGKPSLSLLTLENLVGDATMTRILRTYARRHMFGHPASEDFIAVVNEVTGKDYRWFFDETWFSSGLCDYAVSVTNQPARRPEGFVDGPDGQPSLRKPVKRDKKREEQGPFDAEVTVRRLGEVRMPVELLVEFADGSRVRESWDGQYRWTRFRYAGESKVVRAVVDPEHVLAIDIDPANNAWLDERGTARRAAFKWSARFLLWLQDLLERHTLLV